jgi:hypothetical protein
MIKPSSLDYKQNGKFQISPNENYAALWINMGEN